MPNPMRMDRVRFDKKGDAVIIMETNTPWNRLIELLENEIGLYRALMDLIEAEASALMRSDLPTFKQLLQEKQRLVESLQNKEEERSAWVAAHFPEKDAKRLKDLVARAPRSLSKRLSRYRRELIDLTQALEIRNQVHKRMLKHSRELADNALRLLGNQLYLQPIYQSNGHISGTRTGGAVLSGLA
jgi:flagellar biosynthesis/type III secretory pathway chaperone